MQNNKLDVIVFAITTRCNLKCSFCSRNAGQNNLQDLPLETINNVLIDIMELKPKIIGLTGGETLLYPHLFELLNVLTNYELDIRLSTNATLLTDQTIKSLIEHKVKQINTSLDGHNSILHDSIRRVNGSFNKTIEALRGLKENNMPFFIKTTATKTNCSYLPDIMDLAIKLGAMGYAVSRTIPLGRASLDPQKYFLDWNEYKKSCQLCIKKSEEYGVPFYIDDPLKSQINTNLIDYAKKKYGSLDNVFGGCMAGINILYVLSNGNIISCPALDLPIGNVNKDSIKTLWQESEILLKLRDRENLKGACSECKYKFICGGCRAMAYCTTGDYLEEDPFCPFVNFRNVKLVKENRHNLCETGC
ncbi:radical SAM protein [archaeon]|nr:radical SAM protein [archaeon]